MDLILPRGRFECRAISSSYSLIATCAKSITSPPKDWSSWSTGIHRFEVIVPYWKVTLNRIKALLLRLDFWRAIVSLQLGNIDCCASRSCRAFWWPRLKSISKKQRRLSETLKRQIRRYSAVTLLVASLWFLRHSRHPLRFPGLPFLQLRVSSFFPLCVYPALCVQNCSWVF